jgi:hypothetical protein
MNRAARFNFSGYSSMMRIGPQPINPNSGGSGGGSDWGGDDYWYNWNSGGGVQAVPNSSGFMSSLDGPGGSGIVSALRTPPVRPNVMKIGPQPINPNGGGGSGGSDWGGDDYWYNWNSGGGVQSDPNSSGFMALTTGAGADAVVFVKGVPFVTSETIRKTIKQR